mmetsp:Transcript_31307/g.61139  ORF Transcript_31307/g.61139 Transcript_31307/m.61139 type:complete len:404 (-) Transcript_31307:145-1356(-)|eukprot:CAMPEP_0173400340 /NCGR_PEP_ID=MMETSP1356-20130122/47641_1 /TAXON_ID=77927 ORGANISM="Hemiselmis virescens, Strain PCC157" /NCGR_SAMPLE_ID=MMETSP1356 /ASSEMBLY_ACC=CAM_ASM_000847 /LENGTH=403 /DNA_ID=CAMNT_0014360249 /DNA_START=403 /DNA_END=1614 /DNA_ORIENTATION=+
MVTAVSNARADPKDALTTDCASAGARPPALSLGRRTKAAFAADQSPSPRAVDVESSSAFWAPKHKRGKTSSEPVPIRLVTYNIHGWRDTFHKDNFDGVVDAINDLKPDVLTLQEVLHPYAPPTDEAEAEAYFALVKSGKGNGFDASSYMSPPSPTPAPEAYLDRLAAACGLPHVSFGKAMSDGYFGTFGYGNAVLSRFPIADEEHHVIKPSDLHRKQERRIEAEDRCFSAVTLRVAAGKEFTFCVTHLDQLSDPLRKEQVGAIMQLAGQLPPHVFAGDFNVFRKADCSPENWRLILDDADSKGWPHPPEDSEALKDLEGAGYSDAFYRSANHTSRSPPPPGPTPLGDDQDYPGPTCWVTKPLLRIDYVFISPMAAGSVTVGQHQRHMGDASDHFAVVAELEIE